MQQFLTRDPRPAPKGLEAHPLAGIFPFMSGEETKALEDSIRKDGVVNPIVLHEDKILDGRNRYAAAMRLKKPCPAVKLKDPSKAAEFVMAVNAVRRSLTKSQLACVGANMGSIKHGGDRKQKTKAPTLAELAKGLGVARSSISKARELQKASPSLFGQVLQGMDMDGEAITLNGAYDRAGLEKPKPREKEAARPAQVEVETRYFWKIAEKRPAKPKNQKGELTAPRDCLAYQPTAVKDKKVWKIGFTQKGDSDTWECLHDWSEVPDLAPETDSKPTDGEQAPEGGTKAAQGDTDGKKKDASLSVPKFKMPQLPFETTAVGIREILIEANQHYFGTLWEALQEAGVGGIEDNLEAYADFCGEVFGNMCLFKSEVEDYREQLTKRVAKITDELPF